MSFFQALFIAIVQGATELFPVSSLGHAVILPKLLHWSFDQKAPEFLPFLVVLHLGTGIALLAYFWREWWGFAESLLGRGKAQAVRGERKVLALICVATIPAVILGFGFEHKLKELFGTPWLAAFFLVINGFILFFGDKVRHRGAETLDKMSFKKAFIIGLCQALALIPGISRSGTTIVGGLIFGLSHREAARFSFLIATPVIMGAAVLEIPKLLKIEEHIALPLPTILTAGVVAGFVAYSSTALLMRYFKKHDFESLKPFAFYCWAAGAFSILLMSL